MALGLAALVIAVEIQVRLVEEPYLLRTHGEVYSEYVSQTGKVRPRLAGRTGKSSIVDTVLFP